MKLLLTISAILLSSLFVQVFAQEFDPDALFSEAQKNAANHNHTLAIEQINQLVAAYPENTDYAIYLANLYYWSEQYDLAHKQALYVLAQMPLSEEVYNLLVRIELAAKKSEELLEHSEKGIELFPEKIDFYKLYKAQALLQLEKDKEALVLFNEFEKTSDHYQDAQYLKTELLKKQKNMISVGYLNTSFSNPGFAPWHFGTIEYQRKTNKNALVGRLNYGKLFGTSGIQAEVDAYPKIGKNGYLYLNTGVSDGTTVFPIFRFSAEYYQEYTKYSASIGGRYLHFEELKVFMFTGHIGRKFNDYTVAYRPSLVSVSDNYFTSHAVSFRKNFEQKESFVQVELQYGAVPYYFFVSEAFLRTNAFRAGFHFKFRIKDNFFIQPIFMYEYEEYIPDEYRNKYNAQLILSKRF